VKCALCVCAVCTVCCVQCDNESAVDQPSDVSIVTQNSTLVRSAAELTAQPEADNILTNIPPPVNKAPSERLVPLDLQPFVRYTAVVSLNIACSSTVANYDR